MRQLKYLLVFWLGLSCHWQVEATEKLPLAEELRWAEPFLDIVWRGVLAEQSGKKMLDHSLWQRALNGQAIKVIHSVNDGEYGGESIIFWHKAKQSLAYYYFTTAGFYTHGTMQYNSSTGQLTAEEQVENNANGITKVRSVSVLKAGELHTSAEYLQRGSWVAGHSARYVPSKEGQVKFR
jgi:hypothetical protein